MGVKGLNKLIKEHSPNAYKEYQLKNLFEEKLLLMHQCVFINF